MQRISRVHSDHWVTVPLTPKKNRIARWHTQHVLLSDASAADRDAPDCPCEFGPICVYAESRSITEFRHGRHSLRNRAWL